MTALVVLVDGAYVDVEFQRHTACEKCGMCGHGGMADSETVRLRVQNACGAKVGNMVLIEGGSGFGAVGLAYGLPLLFMVVLAGLGYIVVKSDWAVLAGCGVGVVAGFVLARVLGRRKSYVPKAVCVAPPRHSACGRNDGGARA